MERHEQFDCSDRPTNCKYYRIGCQWRGPNHESKFACYLNPFKLNLRILYLIATEHERNCLHPTKSGYEVMTALEIHDAKIKEEKKMFSTLIDLLSYEKIIFNGKLTNK